jgi:hypothetical protein
VRSGIYSPPQSSFSHSRRMNADYLKALLGVFSGLDQMQTDAEVILHGPRDA